jgi:hypothetical protein
MKTETNVAKLRPEPTPYQVAEICYNPAWPDSPWYVIRSGTVPEQGGLAVGTETLHFKTVEAACNYLNVAIFNDIKTIKNLIKDKENQ